MQRIKLYICFLPPQQCHKSKRIQLTLTPPPSLSLSLSLSLYLKPYRHSERCNRPYAPTYIWTNISMKSIYIYLCIQLYLHRLTNPSKSQVKSSRQRHRHRSLLCHCSCRSKFNDPQLIARFVWPTVRTARSPCVIKNEIKLKTWYIWRAFNQNFYGRD